MVRLMLVLAPVMCILSGIAVSASLTTYMKYFDVGGAANATANNAGSSAAAKRSGKDKKYGANSEAAKHGELVRLIDSCCTIINSFNARLTPRLPPLS